MAAFALVVASAVPAAAQDETRVELPFDGVVDGRTPVVVRVPGAARVRGARGPWCLPVSVGSAEFVLPLPPLPGTALSIDTGDRIVDAYPAWRTIDPPVILVVDGAGPSRVPGSTIVEARSDELPGVSAPYAVFEAVHAPATLAASTRAAIERARVERTEAAARLDPATWEPELDVYRAALAEAGLAADLPPHVVTLWLLLAALQLALVGWARWRRPDARLAVVVLALPGVVTVGWLLAGGSVDGRVRARVACYSADDVATVLLHVAAAEDTEVRVRPAAGAGVVHPLRYDVDDESWRDASVGHEVRMALGAGQSRLLAYRVLGVPRAFDLDDPPPRDVAAWLRRVGLRATGETFDVPVEWLPTLDGHPVVAAPGRRVEPGK